ncbi:MAG: tRNA epoxyqueuosine(34) reductase QueG [Magnetospirillum sp.]|nr:tRNA epoxyqueuosine(34) reductase QueG [Magnetospirillum sp.]
MTNPKDRIRAKAAEIGFDAVGFAAATGDWGGELDAWLAEGRGAGMAWMGDTAARRRGPRALWPEVRSVVVLGLNYAPADDPRALLAHPDRGLISTYARNRDYHDIVKGRLKQLAGWMAAAFRAEVKVFVDTAPVMEKPLAAQGGLGWQGRHTNLVSRRFGSWLVLGEVFTTLELEPDAAEPDRCGRCHACRDACPTAAIDAAGRIDPRRCISYLTIEHKGPIPEALRPLMGNRIYGCDDCLAVCPWNKFAPPHREAGFLPRAELAAPRLADLAALDDAGFRALFSASPVKRIGRDRFVRNVLIAIGNAARPALALASAAAARLDDPSPLVRDAAAWAIQRLALEPEAGMVAE